MLSVHERVKGAGICKSVHKTVCLLTGCEYESDVTYHRSLYIFFNELFGSLLLCCGTLIDVQCRHDNAVAVIKSRGVMKSV
jgi:hypothetical protein